MSYTAPGGPMTVALLVAQSADETFSKPVDVRGYTHIVVYVIPNGTVSSGVVKVLEACPDPDSNQPGNVTNAQLYSGTWVQVGSDISPSSGAISVLHLTVAAYSHLQARISTAIGGGGTVDVVLVAA